MRSLVARVLVLAVLLSLARASGVAAQFASGGPEPAQRGPWWTVWSHASRQDRVMWNMWTIHINHFDEGISNDHMRGIVYRGGYGATFWTTHGPRGYSLGVERDWVSGGWGPVGAMLGFRTGLVYGYDRRLGYVADWFPILPFAQPVVYAWIGPIAADLTYTWVVVSLTASMRF